MTISKAKKALADQKQKLIPNDQWIIQTASIIESIFGKESNEYFHMSRLKFTFPYTGQDQQEFSAQLEGRLSETRTFLDNCIENVEIKGVYRKPSVNFLSDLSTSALLSYLLGAALVIFSGGFYLGEYFTKIDLQELKNENKSLKDSLLIAKPFRENSDKTPDDHSKKKNSDNY